MEERADVLRLLLKPGVVHCDKPDRASLSPVPVPGEDCIAPSAAAAVLLSKNAVSPLTLHLCDEEVSVGSQHVETLASEGGS